MSDGEARARSIGPYRVLGTLGRGGMGEVLRGWDDRLGRPVALKRIQEDAGDPGRARLRFRREAKVAARLSHQGIVQVYDWVEAEGRDWLVMELVEGRALAEILQQAPLEPLRVIRLARQIAEALSVAHGAGLVHRDLKPDNVMVVAETGSQEGETATLESVKILDFGIAKRLRPQEGGTAVTEASLAEASLTEAGSIVGTVAWMSPEQALGWPVDGRSDLFALGILLYEMLSGRSPFRGASSVETLSRICTLRHAPLAELAPQAPGALADLVDRLLAKEPAHRPESARAVVDELLLLDPKAAISSAHGPAAAGPSAAARPDREATAGALAGSPTAVEPSADLTVVEPALRGDREAPPERESSARRPALGALALALVALAAVFVSQSGFFRDSGSARPAGAPEVEGRGERTLTVRDRLRRGAALLERYDLEGHIARATEEFQRALALEPDSAPALVGLARAYWLDFLAGSLDAQRLVQARAAAERAVEQGEYLASARVVRGLVAVDEGELEKARADFAKALELEPLNAEARYGLARLRRAEGDLKAAISELLPLLECEDGAAGGVSWHHLTFLGTLHFQGGQYQEAEDLFTRSLGRAPDNFMVLRNLGAAHYMQSELGEAASAFQ
ncbi:MAG: protein kinase, partial [Acidobacteriota bacterium]